MTAATDIPNLNSQQLTSLGDEVFSRKPNDNNDYYLAIEVSSDTSAGEKRYKFVQVKPEFAEGVFGDYVSFHSEGLNSRSVNSIAKKARKNTAINAQTLAEFRVAQENRPQPEGFKRNPVIISQTQAREMKSDANHYNGYALLSAVEKCDFDKVSNLIDKGVHQGCLNKKETALSAAIQIDSVSGYGSRDSVKNQARLADRKKIINKLLENPQCDPTSGEPSALQIAFEQKDKQLLKQLLVHCVKDGASPRRVNKAVNFCIANCPYSYPLMSGAMAGEGTANKKLWLNKTPDKLFKRLMNTNREVAKLLFKDMQQGCVYECESLKAQIRQNPDMPDIPETVIQGWQTCFNYGMLLSVSDADYMSAPPVYKEVQIQSAHPLASAELQELEQKCKLNEELKVRIDGVDRHGKTVLMHAVESDNPDLVRKLVDNEGANPNTRLQPEASHKHLTFAKRFICFIFRIKPKYKVSAADFAKNTPDGKDIKRILNGDDPTRVKNRGISSDNDSNPPVYKPVNRHAIPVVI